MVRGDLIVDNTDGRIKTRSRARQSTSPQPNLTTSTDSRLVRLYEEYQAEQYANETTSCADPDKYTSIPASLKIVKVLIEELLSASGVRAASNAASAAMASAQLDLEEEDGDDDWEDDDDTLDLTLGSTKADLMSFMEGSQRQPDDETQAYLTEFFIRCGRENLANFQDWYGLLTEEEKAKLNELATSAGQ